jgi:hypothetical protein
MTCLISLCVLFSVALVLASTQFRYVIQEGKHMTFVMTCVLFYILTTGVLLCLLHLTPNMIKNDCDLKKYFETVCSDPIATNLID